MTTAAPRSTPTVTPWAVFGLTSIAVILVAIDSTVLFAAFGAIRTSFPDVTSNDLSWVLNAYTIVYAALLVPSGRLADTYGHKRIFLSGSFIFLLASAICGFSQGPTVLIAARVLQAVGAAFLTPSSLSLVLGAFPAEKRPIAVALWGAVGALAGAVGPSLGSAVVDHLGWQYVFFMNVPLALYPLIRGLSKLKESKGRDIVGSIDVPGIALLIGGVALMALGVVKADVWGINSWYSGIAFIGGLGLILLFIVWARRNPSPALDLTLFENATFRYVNLATFCFGIVFTMMFFGFFFFLTHVWGYSLSLTGLAISPGPLLVIPVAMVGGRIAARIGHRSLLTIGGLIYALGGAWLHFGLGHEAAFFTAWLPGLLLTGVGVGLVLPSLTGAAVFGLPPNRFGVGIGVNTAIRLMGSVFGVAFTIILVGGVDPSLASFKDLYLCLIAGGLLTALLCLPVKTAPVRQKVVQEA